MESGDLLFPKAVQVLQTYSDSIKNRCNTSKYSARCIANKFSNVKILVIVHAGLDEAQSVTEYIMPYPRRDEHCSSSR